MLYTERHKNLKSYRIGRGSITRPERDSNGLIIQKRYVPGDTIMLTEAGAKAMHGNHLQEVSRAGAPVEVSTNPKKITVPDDWREMRKADLLALAAAISDTPVKRTADAVEIIEEYLANVAD